jgi:hypothetical protein
MILTTTARAVSGLVEDDMGRLVYSRQTAGVI